MSGAILEGGCLCGRVRYRVDGPLLEVGRCHCRSCRRGAGAESVTWATVRRGDFALTGAPPAAYASSPGVERTFCPACGSSLTFRASPDSIDLTVATLDDPEAAPPRTEIWLSHRLSWTPLVPGLPRFDGAGGQI